MGCGRCGEPVGAGVALGPNGLRAFDMIGAGNALRALAVPQELGIRRSDGRWLIRSTTGQMISDRFNYWADDLGPIRGPGHSGAPYGRDRRAGGPRSRRDAVLGNRGDIGGARRERRRPRVHHGGRARGRPRSGPAPCYSPVTRGSGTRGRQQATTATWSGNDRSGEPARPPIVTARILWPSFGSTIGKWCRQSSGDVLCLSLPGVLPKRSSTPSKNSTWLFFSRPCTSRSSPKIKMRSSIIISG
jgi:hypothetical protein